jgi:asparagine synthase (glutamine-hydrolysing)
VSGREIAGDVRLDNRDELLRAFDLRGEARAATGDLELVRLSYGCWGARCVERLLGDFAFLISDPGNGTAFGARDPLGVKPFYYRVTGPELAFATRASALPGLDGRPLEIDPARLADAFIPALECFDTAGTLYAGVFRLPPGHTLTFDRGRSAIERFWAPDPWRELRLPDDRAYVEAFRDALGAAVRCRMTEGSAAMLSGGLDSSAIVALARAAAGGREVTTVSAVTDNPGCEESRHVRAVAALPGLRPLAVKPADVPGFREEIARFVESIEEPFDATMMLPLLIYAEARRHGFVGVLDGVDGDVVASHEPEILAPLVRTGAWGSALREARGAARFYAGSYEPWSSTVRLLGANAFRAVAPRPLTAAVRALRRAREVREVLRESILDPGFAASVHLAERLRALSHHRATSRVLSPREQQAREIVHPQIPAALERYHRVAASQGVEARHPFLDRRVVELGLALPWEKKVRDGWTKEIVRRATAGLLPDEVRRRRGRWVRLGPVFLSAVIELLDEPMLREASPGTTELSPYVDRRRLAALWERRRRGDVEAGEALWRLMAISIWIRGTKKLRYDSPAPLNGPPARQRLPLAG